MRDAALSFVLDDEVGGVGRDDAVFARELGDLVLQFLVLTAQANLIEQEADAARGPEARDEFVIVGLVRKFHVVGEFLRLAVDRAFDLHRAVALTGVTAGEQKLLALEQVGHGRGIEFGHAHRAGEGDLGIRQHRFLDLGEEGRDFDFDVFFRQHVLAEGFCLLGDFVEQMRVHVGADAEAEDARVGFVRLLHRAHDQVFLGVADGRTAVGEEDDDVGSVAFVRADGLGFLERVVNGGAADGLQIFDEIAGARAGFRIGVHELFKERLDLGRETHDLEAVHVVQIFHAEKQRLLGLFELRAGHRAGGVEDEDDILGDDPGVLQLRARRGEQQEIAVVIALFEGQQIHAQIGVFLRVEKLEVRIRLHVVGLEADHRPLRAVAFDLDLVAGGVDRLERVLGFQLDFHAEIFQRLGGKLLGVERKHEVEQPGVGLEHMRVAEADFLPAIRLDGENPHLEKIAAGIL